MYKTALVFSAFFLLGPVFAAMLQFILLNLLLVWMLLWVSLHQPEVLTARAFVPLVLINGFMEVSGLGEAILIVIFGLPASLLVGTSATLSYLIVKRVSLLAVVVTAVSAVFLERVFAPAIYFGYLVSHDLVRGPVMPLVPDDLATNETGAIVFVSLLHLLPALMCWWLAREIRSGPN